MCNAGLVAMAGYEVFHVLPKRHMLITAPMDISGTTVSQAVAWLAAFGAVYNCHRYASCMCTVELQPRAALVQIKHLCVPLNTFAN